jgi:hypothetical protein
MLLRPQGYNYYRNTGHLRLWLSDVGDITECAFGFWEIKVIGFGSVGCLRNLRAHYVETLC